MKQDIIDLFESSDYLVSGDFDLDLLEAEPGDNGHLVVLGMKVVEEEREARVVTLSDEDFDKYQASTLPSFKNSIISAEDKTLKVFKCDFWRRSFLALWKLHDDYALLEEAFGVPFGEWIFSGEDTSIRNVIPTEYVYGESSNGQGIEYVIKDDDGKSIVIDDDILEEEYDNNDDEIISYKFVTYDGSRPFRVLVVSLQNGVLTKSEIHDEDRQEYEGSTEELMAILSEKIRQHLKSF
jgi:hypothetical protein